MSLLDRLRPKRVEVQNIEPNRVVNVGFEDIEDSLYDNRSEDWVRFAPNKIKPTIKNCRKASQFPTVYGILNNLIMKTLSSYVIDGEDEEAVNHILDVEEEWNLRNLMYEVLWKCLVDGETFYEKILDEEHIRLRLLAFDGEKALIKKIYDEDSNLKGYKQLVVRKEALKKWKGVQFWEMFQDQDIITVDFEPDEITNPMLIQIDGVGQSLVKNVIDIAYYIESLTRMMPSVVFKQSDVMVATLGNSERKETKLDKEARDELAKQISNYHKKGVITVPYGIELSMVGDNVLPKIQDYIKSLKSLLYEGLVTPESLYSSESSNRSTAQVQLTDNRTGHVLFIEFCQEFLKSWIERELFDLELEKHGFEKGSVYIDFMTGDENLDTNYLVSADVDGTEVANEVSNQKGSTALTTDPNPYETQKGKE